MPMVMPPRSWTPTEDAGELRDLVGHLSDRAIGTPWHPQTANGSVLFARYGGRWGVLTATEVAEDLTRMLELARRHDIWPALSPGSDIMFVSYKGLRDQWRIIEGAFLVRDEDGVIHAQTRARGGVAGRAFACDTVEQAASVRPLTKPDYTAKRCTACADWVTANAPIEIDWALDVPTAFPTF